MAKNTNFVSHKKSKLKNQDGSPQLPLASALVEGEIAINFGKDVETLSIKNESGDVVTFSSDNYYSEQKLGSAFTGANSAVTVTDVIEENEEIIAAALTDLDERKLDASAYTPSVELWESGTGLNSVVLKNSSGTASGDFSVAEGKKTTASGNYSHAEGYYTTASGSESHSEGINSKAIGDVSHAEGAGCAASGNNSHAEGYETRTSNDAEHASGQFNVSSSGSSIFGHSGNTLFSVGNGSYNARHNAFEIRQNGDIYIVSKNGQDVRLQDELGGGDSLWEAGSGNNSVVLKNSSGTASSDFAIADGVVTTASGPAAHAEGLQTLASGESSHAEGAGTSATSYFSHAEGADTIASGISSHAEGTGTTASGDFSHAEGTGTTASGNYSHAEGHVTSASGAISHAEGASTKAIGECSHAEGNDTKASGECSHAEGSLTVSNGLFSHAEGEMTITSNRAEHASGWFNVSNSASTDIGDSGNTLFSVGNGNITNGRHNAFEIRQNGDIYIANTNASGDYYEKPMIKLQDNLGGGSGIVDQVLDDTTSASTNAVSSKAVYKAVTDNELVWTNAYVTLSGTVSAHTANTEIHVTAADKARWNSSSDSLWESGTGLNSVVLKGSSGTASGDYSVAEGVSTIANGYASHAEGNSTSATTYESHAEGGWTLASGSFSHAEGSSAKANGMVSHAEGMSTTANGQSSHAEGERTTAGGSSSHAEGNTTTAGGDYSHAEGSYTKALGNYSHAEGSSTLASGYSSHAEGERTTASGSRSHAEGGYTIANNVSEHASGQYNISSTASTTFGNSGNTLFSVGNGTADNARHNAFEIRQNGDIYVVSGGTNILLQDNIGKIDVISAITPSNSGSTAPIATKVVAENEQIVSAALTDLDERKLDASVFTNHVHDASGVTAMTGYQIAASSASVLTTDTLLQVIGKLEKRIALLEAALGGVSIVRISQTDYDNLPTPRDSNILYIITD